MPSILIIAGTTASGKSSLAMRLAKPYNGQIVNADASQLYAELSVLTARPPPVDLEAVPHHLYGHINHKEIASAASWTEMAANITQTIMEQNSLPIICGGTGFYLDCLTNGISPIPEIRLEIREPIRNWQQNESANQLWERLRLVDPIMAERLHPNDRQRIARALEVMQATGKSLIHWQSKSKRILAPFNQQNLSILKIALIPPRDQWLQAQQNRLEQMMQSPIFWQELEALNALNLPESHPLMKAIGVREFMGVLNQQASIEDAIEKTLLATRQYAKRQETWLKHQFKPGFQFSDWQAAIAPISKILESI